MFKLKTPVLLLITLLIISFPLATLKADHILGGELYYSCNGSNNITVYFKNYFDCNEIAQPDNNIKIFVRDMNGNFIFPFSGTQNFFTISMISDENISDQFDDNCMGTPPVLCRNVITYSGTVALDPVVGGFELIYQRCCRQDDILNLLDWQQSNNNGSTYSVYVPHEPGNPCTNSSPVFNFGPPVVIGANFLQSFNYSATDPDGDQLVYRLCTPYAGLESGCNDVGSLGCPDLPFNIFPLEWGSSYSENNQVGGTPTMNITNAGIVNCKPASTGNFVTAICVDEYDNGQLISSVRRDFTFVIVNTNSINAELTNGILNPDGSIDLYECNDLEVEFNNSSVGADSFHWDFGDPGSAQNTSTETSPTHLYSAEGDYEVELIAYSGICNDTAIINLHIQSGFESEFNVVADCPGLPAQFNDLTTTNLGTILTWQWIVEGDTITGQNPTYTFQNSGTQNITLIATTNNGCELTSSQTIELSGGPTIGLATEALICDNEPYILNPIVSNNAVDFSWLPITNLSNPNVINPTVNLSETTTYTLTATDASGCVGTASIELNYGGDIPFSLADYAICANQDTTLTLSNITEINWSPTAGIDDPQSFTPTLSPSETTTYIVSYSNACIAITDTFTVTIFSDGVINAGDDEFIFAGESVQLNGTANAPFHWEPATGLSDPSILNPIASPVSTTTYTLMSGDTSGCISNDEVTVTVDNSASILAPSAFSPNGDGVNDKFRVFTNGIDKLIRMEIYDRWGKVVYSTSDIAGEWNGIHKSELCDVGVYVFVIVAIDYLGNEVIKKGNLTIVH